MLSGGSGFDVLCTLRGEGSRVQWPGSPEPAAPCPVTLDDLAIDEAAREVRRGTEPVPVTRTEFDLLAVPAGHPGRVTTRTQLAEQIFGGLYEESERTIDSHVRNLRRTLGSRPDGSDDVETVRGVGHRVARA